MYYYLRSLSLSHRAAPQPVPEVTRRHFEMAMKEARRSVSDSDLAKYSSFATTLQQQRSNLGGGTGVANFAFPNAGGGVHGGAGTTQPSAGAAGTAAEEEDLYA